jgi:WD40 repeat protein
VGASPTPLAPPTNVFPTTDFIPLAPTAGRTFITKANLDQVVLLARIVPPIYETGYGIVAVDFSFDGRYIAVGDNRGWVHFYDFATLRQGSQEPVFSRQDGTSTMWDIAFHPYLDRFVTCTASNELTLSDFEGNVLAQYDVTTAATQCNYSPSADYIVYAGGETVQFFVADESDGVRLYPIERTLPQSSPHDAIFSPDGEYMIVSGGTGFTVWDTETYSSIVTPYENNTWSVNPFPNGNIIATGANGFVALYNIRGRQIATFTGHSMDVIESAYDPTSSLFVTGSWDANVLFWDATGEITRPLHTLDHGEYIVDVGWSRDGAIVASVGNNGYLHLWGIP